jgi:hypothetical protein
MIFEKGQKVKIFLKSGYCYGGEVLSTSELFVTINDRKLNKPIGMAYSEISNFEVEE